MHHSLLPALFETLLGLDSSITVVSPILAHEIAIVLTRLTEEFHLHLAVIYAGFDWGRAPAQVLQGGFGL